MKQFCKANEWCNCTRREGESFVQFRDCRFNYRGKSAWRTGLIIGLCLALFIVVVLKIARVV